MKRCPRCQMEKTFQAFSKRKRGGWQSWCKECTKLFQRGRPRILLAKRLVREAKDGTCADCGIKYPYYVMDFDHRPGTVKRANLTVLVNRGASREVLLAEIAKCDLVCANCHRERTYQRKRQAVQNHEGDVLP